MNKFFKHIIPAAALILGGAMFTACTGDLNVEPIDPSLQTEIDPGQLFTKCYANFAVAGQGGANGDSDVDGIDGGTSGLYRQMWNSNELTTDEAMCVWGDPGIPEFNYCTYDGSHPMLRGYYYRLYVGIAFCNQYLQDFADHNSTWTAEVRFLRALDYFLLMDAYGNVPFVTSVSSEKPRQASRQELFDFVESELLAVIGEKADDNANILNDPKPKKKGEAGYGRVDKAAAWLLLSRLYLNAQVYTGTNNEPNGTARWSDAKKYAQLVMNSPYEINTTEVEHTENGITYTWTPYQMLFMGDNDRTNAANECIFALIQDGQRTTSWGVSLFLMASTHDDGMHSSPFDAGAINGVSGQAWGGNHARPELVRLFFPDFDPIDGQAYDVAYDAGDDRALFTSRGHTVEIADPTKFTDGLGVGKFSNFTTDGSTTSDATFPDMDVFFFRKAEAYLTYAEAEIRLNGVTQDAVDAVNVLRNRAHATKFNTNTLTLDKMLDEWGREFYFEGRRRMDLVRFDKFGGNVNYRWAWKGGTQSGASFERYRNIFAIPTTDIIANRENLKQNAGYGDL